VSTSDRCSSVVFDIGSGSVCGRWFANICLAHNARR
jgi:hypothetical protein